ncbi:MAG: FAD-dependent oxidoreductase [Planctomycetota bacterium]|nr:MAG: FAD-dependent oxidoreductase [Planctomycetota bacterium]
MRDAKSTSPWSVVSLLFTAFLSSAPASDQTPKRADHTDRTHDVVVYGGTSAGVVAAIQAARMKRSVVIVHPDKHIGGLTTGGLGWTDSGRKSAIGGLAREFYRKIKAHYDRDEAWIHERRETYRFYRPKDDAMWTFEPHVAERIMENWLKEYGVPVVRGARLDRAAGVVLDGHRIRSIRTLDGQTFRGRMFIDATYEGDLMAAAGVSYTVGRESNATYGETLNGVQKAQNTHNHRFIKPVDPYVRPGDPSSGVLPGINPGPPGEDGAGDHRVQAYCFRMCMTRVPENRVPFRKPTDYDERRYELLFRNFEAGDMRLPLKIDMMPNGKTDTNNNCAVSTDYIGMNYEYPEASYERREQIIAEHRSYQEGLMWTLANHPRVPERIRREVSQWGLAKDEFVDNGHWPHQIYVREARRMVSDYVMTEHDCRRHRVAPDSVGLGSYNMDSHNCQRYITPEGFVQNEGDVQVSPGGPYAISYRSIVPKRGEVENLLVPVCVSASHIAYGSIRMEPVFMILGQSAATAAVLALQDGCSVQDVPYSKLRERLLADGQVLDIAVAGPVAPSGLKPADFRGIVVDDDQAELTGTWTVSRSVGPFIGNGYRHDNNEGHGAKSARFVATLKPGEYAVELAFPPHHNRSSRTRVFVVHSGGTTALTLDQRKPLKNPKQPFQRLGVFRFDGKAEVRIENTGADGYVVIDAVRFLPSDRKR